jgi:hypothetical protein
LENWGIDFIDHFGRRFQVNSAVRTIARQWELIKILLNLNAAPTEGDRMSLHLTGATVDIAKLDMNDQELEWMRQRLLEEEGLDLIDATEETGQAVFHVFVHRTYEEIQEARSN